MPHSYDSDSYDSDSYDDDPREDPLNTIARQREVIESLVDTLLDLGFAPAELLGVTA
jgi:hypothetical protein